MKTRYGVSPWIESMPVTRRPSYPRLRGEETADVVIVGGGMTGCATALALAQAGLRAIVVEADRIGQAGTGHAPGLLMPEPGPAFREVQERYGLRAARSIFDAWRRGALDAAALLRRTGIRCGLEPAEALRYAEGEAEGMLSRDHQARAAAGLDVTWLPSSRMHRSAGIEAGGIRLSGAFVLDPYRAALGLAAAAARRGVGFFERSPVRKLRASTRAVDVTLEGGTVRAGVVIVATGTPGPEIKPLRRHFKLRTRYVVMTEPVPAAVRRQMMPAGTVLRDEGTPGRWMRWTPDHRVLVAGADQDAPPTRASAAALPQRTGQLMYETLVQYPVITGLRPDYGWDVPYADTGDGLMYIGAHRHYPRHLFALGGGDSLTGSFLAARILARAAAGEPRKGDDLFGWTR